MSEIKCVICGELTRNKLENVTCCPEHEYLVRQGFKIERLRKRSPCKYLRKAEVFNRKCERIRRKHVSSN